MATFMRRQACGLEPTPPEALAGVLATRGAVDRGFALERDVERVVRFGITAAVCLTEDVGAMFCETALELLGELPMFSRSTFAGAANARGSASCSTAGFLERSGFEDGPFAAAIVAGGRPDGVDQPTDAGELELAVIRAELGEYQPDEFGVVAPQFPTSMPKMATAKPTYRKIFEAENRRENIGATLGGAYCGYRRGERSHQTTRASHCEHSSPLDPYLPSCIDE